MAEKVRRVFSCVRHFEELETIMDREREALEYQRQQLIQVPHTHTHTHTQPAFRVIAIK